MGTDSAPFKVSFSNLYIMNINQNVVLMSFRGISRKAYQQSENKSNLK